MQPDSYLSSPEAEPRSVPAAEAGLDQGFDHGFGQMLRHAAIPQALIDDLAGDKAEQGHSRLERVLLERFPVEHYEQLVESPADVLAAMEPERSAFPETVSEIVRELEAFDITGLIEIRVLAGGVHLDWRRFERSDLHLGQLWLAETRMLEWLQQSRDLVEAVCGPARSWALAAAAVEIEETTGQTHTAAREAGDLRAYVNQWFCYAWNLQGYKPLARDLLAVKGTSPLLIACGAPRLRTGTLAQSFHALGVSPPAATAAQLRSVAQLLFDTGRLEPEQFSLLSHCDWLLETAQARVPQNWIDRYGELLAWLWIRGDRGRWVESTLELLKRAVSGVAA